MPDAPVDLPHLDKGPRDAPVVVLVHGFPLDHTMWAPQARALEAAGFRVLVPDLRGMGKAPLPPGHGVGSMAAYAADVLRMVERAGVRRFALAGFSMGGYVALEVVRRAAPGSVTAAGVATPRTETWPAGRVTGLALVDTRADPDTDEGRKGRAATIEKVRATGVSVVADAMLPKMLSPAAPPALVAQTKAAMMAQRPEGVIFALEAMAARPGSLETLAKFSGPVAIVVGEKDEVTPVSASRLMMQSALHPALTIVPAPAQHLTTLEAPDAVNDALLKWAHGLTSSP